MDAVKNRAKSKRWRDNNLATARDNASRWKRENPERVRDHKRQWMAIPQNRIRHTLGQAKVRAKNAGLPFSITLADLLPLPEFCPVFGTKLNYGGSGAHGFMDSSPSIDKIIPALGYVPGNVAIISWRANRVKSDASAAELAQVLAYIEKRRP